MAKSISVSRRKYIIIIKLVRNQLCSVIGRELLEPFLPFGENGTGYMKLLANNLVAFTVSGLVGYSNKVMHSVKAQRLFFIFFLSESDFKVMNSLPQSALT